MSKYTATAKNLAGLLPDEDETELSREIEKAIVDAVMEEREACAKECDRWGAPRHVDDLDISDSKWTARGLADAIRARGDV